MKRLILFVAVIMSTAVMFGQSLLPNDPQVRKGKLENGLTYYIRHNDKPAQRAEFYLATNVGAIQETPDQDGLAHFLEHMCFNGTKNLPGKQMLDYLQSIGAEFGRNINASTGVEQTTYMLNNIPVVREGIIDTCLLIMHDYSHYVTCDPEEIDKERGVIIEERRTRRDAGWRMHERSLPYYYGDSKYATCTLIGSQENLETFKPESLWNFYHTWYRPDLQAVIVVGDIDVDKIEAKIKTLFSDIPAAENPEPKAVHEIPGNDEPVVGIITDPEATSTALEIIWKGEPMPEEFNSSDVGFTLDFVKNIIGGIMRERFNDITSAPDAPFISARLAIGNLCETMEVVMGNVSCKDGEAISAFKAFMTEIEKMKRHGFSDDEVQRAKDNLLSYYERMAQGADSRVNADFVQAYISNFFDNYPYMEPEKEYETARTVSEGISAELLNEFAASMITDENLVILYKAPEKEGLAHPSEADFISALNEVKASEIEANEAGNYNVPLLDADALKGSAVKKEKETVYGATEWTLKNGLKVVVLPTEYEMDTGDIILQRSIRLKGTENSEECFAILAELSASAAVEALDAIEKGTATYTPQDNSRASYCRKFVKEDGRMDFTLTATELTRRVRAFYGFPGTYCNTPNGRLKVLEAAVSDKEFADGECGEVLEADKHGITVRCGGGTAMTFLRVQGEGGKAMSARDYLLGKKLPSGTVLG